MFRVYSCLSGEHDLRLVALAGIVCLLASLVAVNLFHRARAANGRARIVWLALAGTTTGCGIWATHFIAILAYQPGYPLAYDIALTALSLAAAIVVTFLGLVIAVKGSSRLWVLIGGAVLGVGIAFMHYTGMYALQVPGLMVWLDHLVVVSIAAGIVFGAASMVTAVHSNAVRGTIGASMLLALAILSHHFTAMGAAVLIPNAAWSPAPMSLDDAMLAVAIAGAAMAILGMSLVGAIADSFLATRTLEFRDAQRKLIEDSEQKLRQQNIRLDAALNNMSQGLCMFDADERIVVYNRRFLELYKLSPEIVRPGCTLLELVQHRKSVGLLDADPEEHCRAIREDVARGPTRHWILQKRDGRTIEVLNQSMPGGGWVTTHEDVTDRQNAEKQVREQKLILDAALNNMNQGLLMFDAQTRLILCNQRYLQMYNLPAEQVKPGITTLRELLDLRLANGTFKRDPEQYIKELLAKLAKGNPVVLM
jgi:NO-binding membrane sensor protein with MHYT domain